METREITNEHGVWLDIEETVSEYHEGQFKEDGFYLDGALIFTWKRADEIRKQLKKGE